MEILIVDDQELILDLTEQMLGLRNIPGLKILKAVTAEQGLKIIMEDRPNLIITDLNLPRKSGAWMVEEAGGHAPRVIFMSGYNVPEITRGFPFLSKPFDAEALLEIIDRTLKTPRRGGILIIERDHDLQVFLRDCLGETKLPVVTAEHVDEGMIYTQLTSFTLILCDADGVEADSANFYKELQERFGDTIPPFIFLASKNLGNLPPGSIYVPKPPDIDNLLQTIKKAIAADCARE